eukprot:10154672-Heterocapsa_arctica.AAC.1
MKALTGRKLQAVALGIRPNKGAGLDGWTIPELRAIRPDHWDELAAILRRCEYLCFWPEGVAGSIICMLPKEAGDAPTAQRPIGLLPMVYRIWAAARNDEVRKWARSKGQDDAWGGKPGAGAMDAAFSLGVEGEAALEEGHCMGAVFLDCSKCYEIITITALYRAAVADGFPPGLARMACFQYQAP